MKFFSIFGDLNLKITDSFSKKVSDLVGLYVFFLVDSDTFNFSAISFGRVILNEEPRFDILITAMSLSGIERGMSGISLVFCPQNCINSIFGISLQRHELSLHFKRSKTVH